MIELTAEGYAVLLFERHVDATSTRSDHLDRTNREALVRRNVRRLERLGYEVSIKEVAA